MAQRNQGTGHVSNGREGFIQNALRNERERTAELKRECQKLQAMAERLFREKRQLENQHGNLEVQRRLEGENHRLKEENRHLKSELQRLKGQQMAALQQKEKEVERLKGALARSRNSSPSVSRVASPPDRRQSSLDHSWSPPSRRTVPASAGNRADVRPAPASAREGSTGRSAFPATSPYAGISDFFREWCRGAGGHVNRFNHFERALTEQFSSAKAEKIFREGNSLGTNFSREANDPIEYWMVQMQGDYLLFPRPLNSKRFKELGPAFEGDITPSALSEFVPAVLRRKGHDFDLSKAGIVR